MEFLKNNARGIIISLLVAGAIIAIASISSDNNETSNEPETAQNEQAETTSTESSNDESSTEQNDQQPSDQSSNNSDQPQVETTEDGYISTTVRGDNQTVVMRRVIDAYLQQSEVELSAEQKLYVETNLVNDIGRNDFIAVDQEIAVAEEKVAQRVEEAQNLSDAAIARWSLYL